MSDNPSSTPPEFEELPPMSSPLVLARFLDVSTRTLERWRKEGRGPIARTPPGSSMYRYARSDVIAWLQASRTDRA